MNAKHQNERRPVWAEVSLRNLLLNLRLIRHQVGHKRKILAIVKANAYGLGAVEISRALVKAGAEWLGVTCSSEAIELREAGIRNPILLLTGFWPGEEERILRYSLTPTVNRVAQMSSLETAAARQMRKGKKRSRIQFHLKIDSGMNRLGIPLGEIAHFARMLSRCPHLQLGGTYTHFASAEDFTSRQTEAQENDFSAAVAELRRLGVDPGLIHLANSGAICSRPSTWMDMVRPGAILYGYHQSFSPPERKSAVIANMPLRPVLSLRTRIISLREVPAGARIGYGATFIAKRSSRIAVLAAGYADGLSRARSNRGSVLIRGQRAPIVGIVSMDLAMVDVTDLHKTALGDVVTIYGKDGKESIEVSDAAREIGTVTSDLLCALGRRVPRKYLL